MARTLHPTAAYLWLQEPLCVWPHKPAESPSGQPQGLPASSSFTSPQRMYVTFRFQGPWNGFPRKPNFSTILNVLPKTVVSVKSRCIEGNVSLKIVFTASHGHTSGTQENRIQRILSGIPKTQKRVCGSGCCRDSHCEENKNCLKQAGTRVCSTCCCTD